MVVFDPQQGPGGRALRQNLSLYSQPQADSGSKNEARAKLSSSALNTSMFNRRPQGAVTLELFNDL